MAGVKGRSGGPRPNSGGARPGAGRKPKPKVVSEVTAESPLDFLEAVMRDTSIDMQLRVRAAGLAAQYRHPKKGEGGKGDERKSAAEKAAAGKFAPAAAPRLAVDNTR